jgi:eukaryotic-like serine/threonine-protein kinase
MNDQSMTGLAALPLADALRLNKLCNRFEEAWKTGLRPQIEAYLCEVAEAERPLLLRELLLLELAYRRQSGDTLSLDMYRQRFPQHTKVVDAAFGVKLAVRPEESNSSHRLPDTGPDSPVAGEADQPACLGRYPVTATVGRGSFGVVYRAYDEELQREVAIKVPRRDRASEPGYAESYKAEARTLARLDHPHIVPVYDVGQTDDGLPFVVSKFIEGSDLEQKIKQGGAVHRVGRTGRGRRRSLALCPPHGIGPPGHQAG